MNTNTLPSSKPTVPTTTTYQFQTILEGSKNQAPARTTFMEAWNDMYKWVKGQIEDGMMSIQVLETCIWITTTTDTDEHSLPFYDSRDLAITVHGWKNPNKK